MRIKPLVHSMVNKIFLSLHFIKSTQGQSIFGRYMVFNLTPIFNLQAKATRKSGKLTYIIIEEYPKE